MGRASLPGGRGGQVPHIWSEGGTNIDAPQNFCFLCAFMLVLILTAFLVRPLQEGHGCITSKMKKALRETQTLRAKIFRPAADPFPGGGAGPPKFNQLEMVTTGTYRPSLVKIDARSFELSW